MHITNILGSLLPFKFIAECNPGLRMLHGILISSLLNHQCFLVEQSFVRFVFNLFQFLYIESIVFLRLLASFGLTSSSFFNGLIMVFILR